MSTPPRADSEEPGSSGPPGAAKLGLLAHWGSDVLQPHPRGPDGGKGGRHTPPPPVVRTQRVAQ